MESTPVPKPLFPKVFSWRSARFAVACAILLGTAGCATLPPPPPEAGFRVQGRLAIRHADEGFSSNFLWAHAPERFAIELWGPLGQGRSRLEGGDDGVVLHAADGAVYAEEDTQVAVRRWLGFDVPVPALAFWIQGRSAPGARVRREERDAAGDLSRLDQLAWSLDFSEWRSEADGRRLPGRIVARHRDVKVTLLPKVWAFANGTP
jgi:outer membrane lipoprotein LolB